LLERRGRKKSAFQKLEKEKDSQGEEVF